MKKTELNREHRNKDRNQQLAWFIAATKKKKKERNFDVCLQEMIIIK